VQCFQGASDTSFSLPLIFRIEIPDLTKLNSNGPADLAKAKADIREAVTDYVNAFDRIRERNAKEPSEGTETFYMKAISRQYSAKGFHGLLCPPGHGCYSDGTV
jgi:hypothetical protein